MKYMGSKRAMLQNGLGELISDEIGSAHRFVDLFAGSGAVAVHVARHFSVPVLAFDLQQYSAILTRAVVARESALRWRDAWRRWHSRAKNWAASLTVPEESKLTRDKVDDLREWCSRQQTAPITESYGGHYFSPRQAVWIDAFRVALPTREPTKTTALAALIQAASQCAAAPGHTAQPFQPTRTAKAFLEEAWQRDIVGRTRESFSSFAMMFARQLGNAEVADANLAAEQLIPGDLAFIDPPYSGVHYSRFYHVLESIAHGSSGEVSGVGRYPMPGLRPRSRYSLRTTSVTAVDELLKTIATRGARAILTFPDHRCSNGLSGDLVSEIARQYFRVARRSVKSKFSTLGGASGDRAHEAGRAARQHANELMLVMEPN